MKRLTISLDDDLAEAMETVMHERGYQNRSEAFRDLLRSDLASRQLNLEPASACVATVSYVYNHHQRQLAMRLTDLQHEHHDMTVATMHAHLDHEHCIETLILRGPAAQVQQFAQSVITQPGVSHGSVHLVPMIEDPSHAHHEHGHGHGHGHGAHHVHHHVHGHLRPVTYRKP